MLCALLNELHALETAILQVKRLDIEKYSSVKVAEFGQV
jgi:hypothetical protein